MGAGRPKGAVSAKTRALELLLFEHKYNPAVELLKLLPQLDERDQARVHMELMGYLYPKRKEQVDEPKQPATPEERFQAAKEIVSAISKEFPQLLPTKNE
jgi:DNA repair photolyase